jgi:hypothetical protein
MTNNSMKSLALQSEAETAVHLLDDWFDPIEPGPRGRVRELIQAMIESELEAALSRPRYARRPKGASPISHPRRRLIVSTRRLGKGGVDGLTATQLREIPTRRWAKGFERLVLLRKTTPLAAPMPDAAPEMMVTLPARLMALSPCCLRVKACRSESWPGRGTGLLARTGGSRNISRHKMPTRPDRLSVFLWLHVDRSAEL